MLSREFEPKDLQEYLTMSRDFFNSDAVDHFVPEKNWQDTFANIMNKSQFVNGRVLLDNGNIAGYLLICFTWSNEVGGIDAWIDEFYIKPEYRGKGLGKTYLKHILKFYSDSVNRFKLEITPSNAIAEKLYLKLGFAAVPYKPLFLNNYSDK